MEQPASLQIGEFVIQQRIGRGGTAMVYRAYQASIKRYVALKLIDLNGGDPTGESKHFTRRFEQEAHVLASLEHPHIVPIYHYGVSEGDYAYIAMRLMRYSLRDMLDGRPLPIDDAIEIALQLINGLGYAHKHGVIHRDIKPGNVLFDEAGSACLGDFGLAKLDDMSEELTKPGTLVGTALYVSPEQVRGSQVDNRSDIYSLGVVIYEMLTGQLPFATPNSTMMSTLYKIEYEQPLPPRTLNPEISPELERIVLQTLHKEPRERFFEVRDLADALQSISVNVQQRRIFPVPTLPHSAVTTAAIKRHYRFVAAALLTLCVLLLILLIGSTSYTLLGTSIPAPQPSSHGSIEEVAPTSAEISVTRQRLGEQGFIAYIACGDDPEATRASEIGRFAATYGLSYRAYDSKLDSYRQLTLIEQARLEGARAIILCPLQPAILTDSLASLNSGGIPYVLTDDIPQNQGGVSLEEDELYLGEQAGNFVADHLLQAGTVAPKVAVLDYPALSFSDDRAQGFIDTVTARIPSTEIILRAQVGALHDQSESTISHLLESGQDVDAIFSVTDAGALGAAEAIKTTQSDPDSIIVITVGGAPRTLDYIYDHAITAVVDDAREIGSHAALDALVKRLGGGNTPQGIKLPEGIVITRDIMVEQSLS